jgi:hypothetical protein
LYPGLTFFPYFLFLGPLLGPVNRKSRAGSCPKAKARGGDWVCKSCRRGLVERWTGPGDRWGSGVQGAASPHQGTQGTWYSERAWRGNSLAQAATPSIARSRPGSIPPTPHARTFSKAHTPFEGPSSRKTHNLPVDTFLLCPRCSCPRWEEISCPKLLLQCRAFIIFRQFLRPRAARTCHRE